VLSHYVHSLSAFAPRAAKLKVAMLLPDLLLAIPKMVCMQQIEEICHYSNMLKRNGKAGRDYVNSNTGGASG